MSQADILAGIQSHVERVAKHHAGVHKAREFIASLTQPGGAAVLTGGKVG
jgi:predicted Rossmann-fold nucleotide-binding protein